MANLLGQRVAQGRLLRQVQGSPEPPAPALATPSIAPAGQGPSIVRTPGGAPQQAGGQAQAPGDNQYIDRIADIGLTPGARRAGTEATQQAILGAVAANAPEGSAIRLIAEIFQAGNLGKQEARAAAKSAAQKQILSDAMAKGNFRKGAAALLMLDDKEGAGLLLDRFDAQAKAAVEQKKLDLDTERVAIDRNSSLSEAERREAQTRIDDTRLALDAQQDAFNRQNEAARTAIQDRNSRYKVENGHIIDVVGGTVTKIPGVDTQQQFDNITKLNTQIRLHPAFKDAEGSASALTAARQSAQANNRQGDIALTKAAILVSQPGDKRITDQDFVVQTGEFNSIENRARQAGYTFVEGRLDPEQRRQMLELIEGNVRGHLDRANEALSPFREQARRLELPADEILDPARGVDTRSAFERRRAEAQRLRQGGGQ